MENKEYKNSSSDTDCMSEDVRELTKAMLLAKKEFLHVGKSGKHTGHKFTYAIIGDIFGAVEASLMDHNIWLVQYARYHIDHEFLITRLIHQPTGQWIQDIRTMESEKPGNTAKGSAQTYMRKYAVLALCGLCPDDDDCHEEEQYIEQKSNEPCITAGQAKTLQDALHMLDNGEKLLSNIKGYNKVHSLSELKQSQFKSVYDYILKEVERSGE